ncbi:MAG: glutathione peroxidase [Endozoicomonas sp.]|uniref:glutathione peroxidase n=1 Tax=Endozoicomonas sp. TaxID=1892382 RepID=UPI003D9BA33D
MHFLLRAGLFFLVIQNAQAGLPEISLRLLNSQHQVNIAERYESDVLLIVNTSAYCHHAQQFQGLQALYQRYRDKGFVVLAFPSRDFTSGETRNEQSLNDECRLKHDVTFPLFAVSHVSGANANALFQWLKEQGGSYPSTDFNKFLVSRNGRLVRSFRHDTRPDDVRLAVAIARELEGSGEKKEQ